MYSESYFLDTFTGTGLPPTVHISITFQNNPFSVTTSEGTSSVIIYFDDLLSF